jgi:hypothetical protein
MLIDRFIYLFIYLLWIYLLVLMVSICEVSSMYFFHLCSALVTRRKTKLTNSQRL